ncbi:MAG: hypothetical protein K0S45_2429 [Nitrospira sp.]|jgi:hypothetical protein|nr:hypothetical protein [Nitrospira sp.]
MADRERDHPPSLVRLDLLTVLPLVGLVTIMQPDLVCILDAYYLLYVGG